MNNLNKKKLINLVSKLLTILILSIIIGLFISKKEDGILKVRIKSAPNTLLAYNLGMADVLLIKLLVKPENSKKTYQMIAESLRPIELKVLSQISYLTKLELSENLVFMQFKNKDINNDSAILEVMNLINTEIEQDIHKLINRYYYLAIEKKINFNQMKINKLSALLSTYRNGKGEIDYETINSADVDRISSTILQSIEGSNKKSLIDDSYSEFFQDFSSKYNDLLFLHKPNIEIALEQLKSYNPEKDDFIILELTRLVDKAKVEKFFVNYGVQKTLSNKPSLYVTSLGIFILLITTYFLIIFLKKKIFSKHLKRKISSLLDLR